MMTKRKQYGDRTFTNKDVWRIYCNNLSPLEQITFKHDFYATQGDCQADFDPIKEMTADLERLSANTNALEAIFDKPIIKDGIGSLIDRFTAHLETSFVYIDAQTTNLEIIGASIDAKMREVEITDEQRILVNKAFSDLADSITNSQLESEVGITKFSKLADWKKEVERTIRDAKSVVSLLDSLIKALGAKSGYLDSTKALMDDLIKFFKGDSLP
jgi:hypothetical protein